MLARFRAALELIRPRTALQTRADVRTLAESVRRLTALAADVRDRDARAERQSRELVAAVQAMTRRIDQMHDDLRALQATARRDAELEDDLEALAAICDESRIAAHVQRAIARSSLALDPFPYVVVRDLLPNDFYAALIRGLPPVELFGNPALPKPQLTAPLASGPVYSRRVWKFMVAVVIPRILKDALVEKFRAPLVDWISANWPALSADPFGPPMELGTGEGRIMLRRRGYEIKPHRDPKWGFLTTIIYLARKGDNPEWGTDLYSVDDDGAAMGAAPHWIDPTRCRRQVEVPFVRNSALVFLNSRGAHGANIPADAEPATLERYIYQFRIGPTADSIKALRALMPEHQQPNWAGKTSEY